MKKSARVIIVVLIILGIIAVVSSKLYYSNYSAKLAPSDTCPRGVKLYIEPWNGDPRFGGPPSELDRARNHCLTIQGCTGQRCKLASDVTIDYSSPQSFTFDCGCTEKINAKLI